MVNYYDKKRFISKSTLARLADVSPRTFSRYLDSRREILKIFGVSPKAQKLPPYAVRYICEVRPNCRTNRLLMPRPSVTSSSNRGKKSRNIKIIPDCRSKSDNALPECSTFAMSKGEQGRIAHSNSLKR